MRRRRAFQPFASRSRRTIIAIVVTMSVVSVASAFLSIRAASGSQHRAAVVQVAERQQMLAERYVQEVLLVRESEVTDPVHTIGLLEASVHALLDGGLVPAVRGDDDETQLSRSNEPIERGELEQEQRLITDLAAIGSAVIDGRDVATVPLTAHEHIAVSDPIQRLRVVAALAANVSLNATRTFATRDDQRISRLIVMLLALGAAGLIVSLLLAWALVAATRRQTEHFRSLVGSSTDLVLVLADGCRYVSTSVTSMLGRPEAELLGDGYERFVHEDDRHLIEAAQRDGKPAQIVVRLRNELGDWRHLEAHVTDLRHDRHVRGVVLNARDITDRVRLESELTQQARRDTFATQLGEALEMADEEAATFHVVERAMVAISAASPTELLLSDSSRAHLEQVATSPTAGSPECPVESPFSCVAVRRGSAVVFDTSESLNACPKLQGRPGGACSAVCVPVSFMGRALGVLHTTGPVDEPPASPQIGQLATLAAQAGARIGTVRAFQRTQLQASTDGLTGLVNRRTLEEHLRALINQGRPFALAMADLDRFKQLNDTHGHEAGDTALRTFSQVARTVLREEDIMARWGGEEFVIVVHDLDRHRAADVLDRMRVQLAESPRGHHPVFTASYGITDSTRAETLEQLLHLADEALYTSKTAGRDRITVSANTPHEASFSLVRDAKQGSVRTRANTASAHTAIDEEDPRPSGLEIR
jgi:diguanylate cyclase (GGDEF)-like protein/PAS domain S-box-containing protein